MSLLYDVLEIKNPTKISFCNVSLEKDSQLFIDPLEILKLNNDFSKKVIPIIQGYFKTLADAVSHNDVAKCLKLLWSLQEKWTASAYTHIGYSTTKKWKAVWEEKASQLYDSLFQNEALRAWIFEGLDDMTILIDGIGKDNVSDIITNVIWAYLVDYSLQEYVELGFKKTQFEYITIWDSINLVWKKQKLELPLVNWEPLILIPKQILRRNFICSIESLIRHGLAPLKRMQYFTNKDPICGRNKEGELIPPTIKDTIQKLRDDQKLTKGAIGDFIIENPKVYISYKDKMRKK